MYRTVTHSIVLVTHINLPLACPSIPAPLLKLRCVAKSALSRIEATVSTPPTMAHVLIGGFHQGSSPGEGIYRTKRTMSKSAQKIDASHDGQREWARFH